MKNELYSREFYKNRYEITSYAADVIFKLLTEFKISFNSIIDFGCGVGTFLSKGKELGASYITGVEGPWVPKNYLMIPKENFFQIEDLIDFKIDKKYDLAICLEVIEHLEILKTEKLVSKLVEASNFILFSAAIPYQGGIGHISEQWLSFWVNKFEEKGYKCLDIIRPKIWGKKKIPFWYKQNIVLFIKKEFVGQISLDHLTFNSADIIHPELFLQKIKNKSLIHRYFNNLKIFFKKFF